MIPIECKLSRKDHKDLKPCGYSTQVVGRSLKIHGDKVHLVQQRKYWQQKSREFKGLVMNGTNDLGNIHKKLSKLKSGHLDLQNQHYTPESARQEQLKQQELQLLIEKFIILTPKRWYISNVTKLGCLAFLLRKEMSCTLRLVIMHMLFVFVFFFTPKDKGYESTCYFSCKRTVFLSKASQCAYYIWINAVIYGALILTLISTTQLNVLWHWSAQHLSLPKHCAQFWLFFPQPLSLIIQV